MRKVMDFGIMSRQTAPASAVPVATVAPNSITTSNPTNFCNTFSQSLVLSDEESLEDHSGLEDFQGVTLQMNETPTPGTPYLMDEVGSSAGADADKKYQEDRAALLLLQSSDNQSFVQGNNQGQNRTPTTPSGVPRISITPMTPPSGSGTPDDGHSTVSLSSSTRGSPMYGQPGQGHSHGHGHSRHTHGFGGSESNSNSSFKNNLNNYWRCQSPMPPTNEFEAKEFFAYRDTIMQNVIHEVQSLVEPSLDGDVRGTWLLTEIDHWDNEKERIILLCTKSMVIVKYDFIAMKHEDHRRVFLCIIDKIIQGELTYPQRSLTPRLGGIAGGLVSVVKGCIFPRVSGTVQSVGSAILYRNKGQGKDSASCTSPTSNNQPQPPGDDICLLQDAPPLPLSSQQQQQQQLQDKFEQQSNLPPESDLNSPKTSIMSALSLENFEPRARNVQGMRIMWNQDLPLSFTQKWNPFNKSIPWITFASHPLLWHKGGGGGINRSFDIDTFSREFIDILSQSGGDSSPMCRVEYKPIIIETYIGLTSLFHNANGLGFYKVRGRVSF